MTQLHANRFLRAAAAIGATLDEADFDELAAAYAAPGRHYHGAAHIVDCLAEFDREAHYISVDSPLARSLLKRELGDEVEVEVPRGRLIYCIVDIAY